jgi:CRP-like cAMP-binding protein
MAEVSGYTATAIREGRWWLIQVPGVGATQSRTLADAPAMARDLIAAVRDVPARDVTVTVEPMLAEGLQQEVREARAAVADLDDKQRLAAALSRKAACDLKAYGLTGADTATVLGVSPQRVSQLMKR